VAPAAKATLFAGRPKRGGAPNFAEIAAQTLPSRQKPRFLPAAQRDAVPNSAEIAAGNFQPIDEGML
jgi:hypothetical protein